MSIKKDQLDFNYMLKFAMLSKQDQAKVLASNSVEDARKIMDGMSESVSLGSGKYEPTIQVSGSSRKYKTKDLFTETFDEGDVRDFISLAEMAIELNDNPTVANEEIKRKVGIMQRQGKQPIQCLIYSTKVNEKTFYNNEKRVEAWAKFIAEMVNSNDDYVESINHMLVNWGMWKYQILLIITACSFIKKNSELNAVIREMYANHDDDKVRFTVIKRLFASDDKDDYRVAFRMLKATDFTEKELDKKYFNALKRAVERGDNNQKEALFDAYRGTQGFSGKEKRRIEDLFVEKTESDFLTIINESTEEQKENVLAQVREKINGKQKDYGEIARIAKDIKKYRTEIQEMFKDKVANSNIKTEEIKTLCLAIGNLDEDESAIPFIKEQMNLYYDDEKKLLFTYSIASSSDTVPDEAIIEFVDTMLKYDGNQTGYLQTVCHFGQTKKPVVRKYLYERYVKIVENKGIDSRAVKTALRNLTIFLQGGPTTLLYDSRFDQQLFDFLGFNKEDGSFEGRLCTVRNANIVVDLLEVVMDKSNYEKRYMVFIWDIYERFKDTYKEVADKIDHMVRKLTGGGRPKL